MATTQLDTAVNDLIDTLKDGREKLANKGITLSSDAGFREIIDKIDDLPSSNITLETYNFTILSDKKTLYWTPSDDTTAVQLAVNDPQFNEYIYLDGYQTTYEPDGGILLGSTWYIRPIHDTIKVNGSEHTFTGATSQVTATTINWVYSDSFWFCGDKSWGIPVYPTAIGVCRYNLDTGDLEINTAIEGKYNLNTEESPRSIRFLDFMDSGDIGFVDCRFYLDWENTYAMPEENGMIVDPNGYLHVGEEFCVENQTYQMQYQHCLRISKASIRFYKEGRYVITAYPWGNTNTNGFGDDAPEGWFDTLIIDVHNCAESTCQVSDSYVSDPIPD